MRKIHIALLLVSIFAAPSVFADDPNLGMSPSDPTSCDVVAKACVKAGFLKTPYLAKHFWDRCMWPTILGKPVKGVTVDVKKVKGCRTDKAELFKKELKEIDDVNAAEKKASEASSSASSSSTSTEKSTQGTDENSALKASENTALKNASTV